ncbi:type I glyceraldehyde-3-phosphate dehydrogenase [Salibaculum griseiflavum]|uniref:Glyceraldehyde-3-phosphate dehydrogenase n=1 Tax=Salibaculum griseiflavum TaxID=1914409 RepID=A0A2V1P2N3_9RHOB|nr:glyceraldehyde 3-phosphate dehydrogenase NAD-binding domain-containing protein [Salibaculum griseiflavum]PWG16771.1 glyceraldehyde-3-phosphate dehydrogenase [Salibaculum griseiflavum]
MTRPIRVFINGFGRIGRSLFRQILTTEAGGGVEIAGVNDIAPLETCAYLLRYDSVYGPFPQPVEAGPGWLTAGNIRVPFHNEADLRRLDLRDVDVVLECTGRAKDRHTVEAGRHAGAGHVLISGPSSVADRTIVMGANEDELGDARIVSNASCTTNAIAPLLKALDGAFGIDRAHVTTVHCYTGSQPTVDQPGANLERSRAAAVSMVPTTTSATDQVTQVLPAFRDRLSVAAVRVPTISVSAVDAVLQLNSVPDGDPTGALTDTLSDATLFGLTRDPCVSTDFRGRTESLVLALPETQLMPGGQLRLLGWYDNEWGFSARMLDMARRMASRDT